MDKTDAIKQLIVDFMKIFIDFDSENNIKFPTIDESKFYNINRIKQSIQIELKNINDKINENTELMIKNEKLENDKLELIKKNEKLEITNKQLVIDTDKAIEDLKINNTKIINSIELNSIDLDDILKKSAEKLTRIQESNTWCEKNRILLQEEIDNASIKLEKSESAKIACNDNLLQQKTTYKTKIDAIFLSYNDLIDSHPLDLANKM